MGRTLRILLALIASITFAGAGCLIPPPLEPEPVPVNHAPRIVAESLSPGPVDLPLIVPEACPDIEVFDATFADDDGDTLFVRVFVDYATAGADRRPRETRLETAPDTPAAYQFTTGANLFVGSNPHTVEVLVADRSFNDSALEQEGRVLSQEDGLIDSFVWTVVLDPGSNLLCSTP